MRALTIDQLLTETKEQSAYTVGNDADLLDAVEVVRMLGFEFKGKRLSDAIETYPQYARKVGMDRGVFTAAIKDQALYGAACKAWQILQG